MKELRKIQVIDLFNKLLVSGLSNAECAMFAVEKPADSRQFVGGDTGVTLAPGVYLAVWSNDNFTEASPLMEYLAKKVSRDTHRIMQDGGNLVLVVFLDEFAV